MRKVETSEWNKVRDLVEGADAALQMQDIEAARTMLTALMSLVSRGAVMYRDTDHSGYYLDSVSFPGDEPVMVIPLSAEKLPTQQTPDEKD